MSFYEKPAASILHPTDFSATSDSAFAHALAIALRNNAELTIMHVLPSEEQEVPWHEYPSVRRTLEQWGHLQGDASRREVAEKLGVHVKKAVGYGKDVVKSIVDYTQFHDIDLIVMATNENREHPFWMREHVSAPVSQKTRLPTLFVPNDVPGCVSLQDGKPSLNRVLIPVDHSPNAQPVLERIAWAKSKIGGETADVTLLHVGKPDSFPPIVPPDDANCHWTQLTRQGDAAAEIVNVAREINADAIAMVTEGKRGFWDALRGSTVQRVLKHAPCLVFTMPADF
jgi:nucleotide-binding universal stress UspA family protein